MATPLYPTNYITPRGADDPMRQIPENNPGFQSVWGPNGSVMKSRFGTVNPTVNPSRLGIGSVDTSSTVGSLSNDTMAGNLMFGNLPTYNQLPSYGPQGTMDQFQQQGTQPSLGIRPMRRYNRLPQLMSGQFQYY